MKKNLLTIGFLSLLVFPLLSGCASEPPAPPAPPPPPMDVVINQVDQVSQLGKKISDGQFVIVQADFIDKSNQPIMLTKDDVMLETANADPKDYYTQPLETSLDFAFGAQYGNELQDKILSVQGVTVYPKIQTSRYLMFTLPKEADLSHYNLLVKITGTEPQEIKIPLVGGATTVNDRRYESP